MFARAGLFTSEVIVATLPLAAATIVALAVGMVLQNRIDGETYRRWLKYVLLVISVMLVGQYGYGRWMGG